MTCWNCGTHKDTSIADIQYLKAKDVLRTELDLKVDASISKSQTGMALKVMARNISSRKAWGNFIIKSNYLLLAALFGGMIIVSLIKVYIPGVEKP